jgi:hypothetical protein
MLGGALFLPAPAAPPPLLRLSTLGGARLLLSVPSVFVRGTGVPFDSLVFSINSGGWTDGDGLMREDGAAGFGVESDGHRASASGARRSMMMRLFFAPAPLLVDLAGVDMVGGVVVVNDGDGVCVMEGAACWELQG